MATQDEVGWLLKTIRDNYPGDSGFPDDMVRVNRDEPKILELDERTMKVDLQRYNAVHVASGSVQREIYGTSPQYRTETTLDVRVEAQHGGNWGESTDVTEFNTLVRYVQHAINTQLVYPEVDPGAEDIGFVVYTNAQIEDENRLSSGDKDYYLTEFTVRLEGHAETP